jgi:hypothetical protein
MARIKPPSELGVITGATVCKLLMLSRQRIDQLVADGWIKRHGTGTFLLVEAVQGYLRFLRESRNTQSAAEAKVREARAREIDIRAAERAGRLVDVEEIIAVAQAIAGSVRSRHVGASSRITRDLNLRRDIDRELNAIDANIADDLEELAGRFASGRAYPAPATHGDAGSVGG